MKNLNTRGIAAGFIVFALITGCTKSAPATGSSGTGDSGTEITVEVFDRGVGVDATKNNWTDWIQKKLLEDEGIRARFVSVPRNDEISALNNMMAAGNPPDVCFTYNTELINNFRDLGGLYDMNPKAETLLPDLKAFLGHDPMLPGQSLLYRNQDKTTKEMYYFPAKRIFQGRYNTFIRKDWLDKLGLPLPASTQEYYDALLAFKEKDPGGIGADNVIAYSSSKNIVIRAANLIESFIDRNLSDKDRWINTAADRSFLLPGYKEGVRFLNKMYNNNLLDHDFPLYTADNAIDDMARAGRAGSFSSNYDGPYRGNPSVLQDLQSNVPNAMIAPIDPFTDSSGKVTKYSYDAAGMYIFIPKSAKNPEAAMRYLNWLAKYDNRIFLQTGPEGITHELVNGVPKAKAVPAGSLWSQFGPQNIDYVIISNGLELDTPERTMLGLANSYTVDPELIMLADKVAMRNARPMPVIPVTLSAAGPYVKTLQDKGDVLITESITCPPERFDQIWDAGIADWLMSGAQVIINERTEKYVQP
ncbi:MAG: extracellular solute-binding protein [Spirochaetaceae bacterium]|jgi:putative aldouronate transport system substrate-binding protein|nr:extracellular solute-binding protein [Spirochaetaceae bacterium]